VVDYKMGEMDGFELIERLRSQRVSAPSVLVTAYPGRSSARRAESSGVRHIVLKPHIEDSLIGHVRAAMSEAHPPEGASGRALRASPQISWPRQRP